MKVIGRYWGYRQIVTLSVGYLFIGFIGLSESADIVICRYKINLYRSDSSYSVPLIFEKGPFRVILFGQSTCHNIGHGRWHVYYIFAYIRLVSSGIPCQYKCQLLLEEGQLGAGVHHSIVVVVCSQYQIVSVHGTPSWKALKDFGHTY